MKIRDDIKINASTFVKRIIRQGMRGNVPSKTCQSILCMTVQHNIESLTLQNLMSFFTTMFACQYSL